MNGSELLPYLAGTGFVGLIGLVATLAWRLIGRTDDQVKHLLKPAYDRLDASERECGELRVEIEGLRDENRRCTRRVEILIRTMQIHGVKIPPEAWSDAHHD